MTEVFQSFPTIYLPVTCWVFYSKMTLAFTTFPVYVSHTCLYLLSRATLHASVTHLTLDSRTQITNEGRTACSTNITTHLWQRSYGAVAPSQHGTFSMERVIRLKFLRPPPDGWHITVSCRAAYEVRPTTMVTKFVSARWRRRVVGKEVYPYSLLNTALSRGEWATTRPGRLYPVEKVRYPLNTRLSGPRAGLDVWEMRKCVAPVGIQIPDRPANGLVTIHTMLSGSKRG